MNIALNNKEIEIIRRSLELKKCNLIESIRKVNKSPYQYIDADKMPKWKNDITIIENILDRLTANQELSIKQILELEIGTKINYNHENITEIRIIGNVLGRLSAISDYGTYMPLNEETYQKYHYKIEVVKE